MHASLLLTRRQSLQLLLATSLSSLNLSGCGSGNAQELLGAYFTFTPTRLVLAQGSFAWVRVTRVADINLSRLKAQLLPSGVRMLVRANNATLALIDVGPFYAASTTVPGRYLCQLRAERGALLNREALFEIIVVPEGHGVGLTLGPYGPHGGTAAPGGSTLFAVTATATQRVLQDEWDPDRIILNDRQFQGYTVSQAGFTGEVRFRVEGLPDGVTFSFDRPTLTLGEGPNGDRGVEEAALITLYVANGVPPGSYPFTVLADHGDPVKTAASGGNLIVGTVAEPTPTPTPRPTPTPVPTPTPTPGPVASGLVFSNVLVPIDARTIERQGTYTYRDAGRELQIQLYQSDTILRQFDLTLRSDTELSLGTTFTLPAASSDPHQTKLLFTQEGGTPYHQVYRAVAGHTLRIESYGTDQIRVLLDGPIRFLPWTGSETTTGSFYVSGSMLLSRT